MPAKYEAMRDSFKKKFLALGMSEEEADQKAKEKAARIYNATRKKGTPPVTRKEP